MKTTLPLLILILSLQPAIAQQEIFVKSGEAIRGYDPVAYFRENKPVKGSDEFTFQWKDATWKFSSAGNLRDFQADPEKYAPQFGGFCAYGVSDGEGHKSPTDPDAWTIVDGKLYLNYSMNVRSIWQKDRKERIENANKNWPVVRLQQE